MTTSIRTRPKALRPKVIFSAVLAALGLGGLQAAHAQQIVGLTQDWQLVTFDSASPTFASAPVSISGLQFNEVLYGIDYRPSTGVLYGLGSFSNLYTLNVGTGAASFVASLTNAAGGGAYSLNANAAYGIDFNPVPDLGQALPSLRVTNSAGDNLRINVNAASAGQVSVDTALNPGTPSVGGSAYINNDTNPATGTALFNIDFAADTLLQQTNPNGGAISTIGALGVATSPLVGFDVGGNGVAYASLTNEITSKSSLYTVNLTTGAATLVGAFGIAGNTAIAAPLMDIAVTPVPEPSQLAMMLGGLVVLGGAASRRRTDR